MIKLRNALKKTVVIILLISLCLFAACSEKEPDKPQLGKDDTAKSDIKKTSGEEQERVDYIDVEQLLHNSDLGNVQTQASYNGINFKNITTSTGSRIISTESYFIVETENEAGINEIKSSVSFVPEVPFTVTAEAAGKYIIEPCLGGLSGKTLYTMIIGDKQKPAVSIAFQTEGEFEVTSMFPANESVDVPCNTGIEVVFSEAVDTESLKDNFEITPFVEGKFVVYPNGRTVAFVPSSYLLEGQIYTVTVKSGVKNTTGKTLEKSFEAKFCTRMEMPVTKDEVISLYLANGPFSFSSKDRIMFDFNCYKNNNTEIQCKNVNIDVFMYKDVHEAIEAFKVYEENKLNMYYGKEFSFSTEGLKKVDSYKITPTDIYNSRWNYNGSVVLNALEKGAYLVELEFEISTEKKTEIFKRQVQLQVTDIVPYTEYSDNGLLIWANQKTVGPIKNAEVEAWFFNRTSYWNQDRNTDYVKKSGNTDENGLIIFEDCNSYAYVSIKSDNDECYVLVSGNGDCSYKRYYNVVLTDREKYFTNDLINVFGIIRLADKSEKMPSKLYYKSSLSLAKREIELDENGTFKFELEIDNYEGYGVSVSIFDENDVSVTSLYLSVTHEEKPLYTATLSFDKLFYKAGEDIKAIIQANFFDGTPAANLNFSLYNNYFLSRGTVITTDASGKAEISIKTDSHKMAISMPSLNYLYFQAELISDETASLYLSESVRYFPANVWYRDERITNDGETSYSLLYLNELDTAKLESEEDFSWNVFPENTYGAYKEGSVKIKLIKHEYKKVKAGTEYDPISKTTQERYTTRVESTTILDETRKFENGQIRLEHYDASGFNGYYEYEAAYYDNDTNSTYTKYIYANLGKNVTYVYEDNSYQESGLRINRPVGPFAIGDIVKTELLNYGKQLTEGYILYSLNSDGISEHLAGNLSDNTLRSFSTIYKDEYIQGANINIAFFDGEDVRIFNTGNLSYDYEKNNVLNVEVVTDKDKYKPGEKAEINVVVTDNRGNYCSNATVLVSLVDEACFALRDQKWDVLNKYYSLSRMKYISVNQTFSFDNGNIYWSNGLDYVASEATKDMAIMPNAVEKPMLGTNNALTNDGASASMETNIRSSFADNPYFFTVVTDENGEAKIDIALPDNITSWRVSVAAMKEKVPGNLSGMELGNNSSNVISSLEFFETVNSNSYYIKGDDIAVSAKVSGNIFNNKNYGDFILYSADILDENGNIISTKEIKAKAGENCQFNFGKLDEGNYDIYIRAVYKDYKDTVKVTISVIKTAIKAVTRRDLSVSEFGTIKPVAYPINISFYNNTYSLYTEVLNKVLYGERNRNDSKVARLAALEMSQKLFGENDFNQTEIAELKKDLSNIKSLLGIYSYAEGDVYLTAKAVSAACEFLPINMSESLAICLESKLTESKLLSSKEVSGCIAGLLALKKPYLREAIYLAECELDLESKLYVTLALANAGESVMANEMMKEIISEYGVADGKDSLYIKGSNVETNIEYTALLLMSASKLDRDIADTLVNYLLKHNSLYESYKLEYASYLTNFYSEEGKNAKIVYKLDGETKEANLGVYSSEYLRLNRKEFDSLEIIEADENVRIYATYISDLSETILSPDQNLKITKTYSDYDKQKGLIKVTVKVSGKTDRNVESFDITDTIFAGGRYVKTYRTDSSIGSKGDGYCYMWLENKGQTMTGQLHVWNYDNRKLGDTAPGYRKEISFEASYEYIIRAVLDGDFVLESAYADNSERGTYALSDRKNITVSGGKYKISK